MSESKKPVRPFSLQLSVEDVRPATQEEKLQLYAMRQSVTYWKDAWKRLKRNKVAMVSLVAIILITLFAVLGPIISPYAYDQQIRGSERLSPCLQHPFGTDKLGRDLLVRNMFGARISLLVGVFCTLIVIAIGSLYGAFSGIKGGAVDNAMMRFLEILYSIPDLLIVIMLQIALKKPLSDLFPNAAFGTAIISIFITFALLYWVNTARMVRGQVLVLKQQEYVTAARAMGAGTGKIILRHLIPNSIGIILVTAMFQIPAAIFTESFLSFIGLGVSAPMPSLGSLCSDALDGFESYPYRMLFPALLISMIMLAFNQFGDGLRDALDPRLRN